MMLQYLLLFLDLFCCFFLLAGRRPVVQIMCDMMAIAALGEFGHYSCRMFVTMAVLTLGNHLVLVLMAERAGKRLMLGRIRSKQCNHPGMTCAAILRWDIGRVGYNLRHMRLVTLLALGNCHVR